jgi:hypothetical protein
MGGGDFFWGLVAFGFDGLVLVGGHFSILKYKFFVLHSVMWNWEVSVNLSKSKGNRKK